jgi:hypothetical protein
VVMERLCGTCRHADGPAAGSSGHPACGASSGHELSAAPPPSDGS